MFRPIPNTVNSGSVLAEAKVKKIRVTHAPWESSIVNYARRARNWSPLPRCGGEGARLRAKPALEESWQLRTVRIVDAERPIRLFDG